VRQHDGTNPAPAPTLDTPFWVFSLAVYGADGVEPECLDLQERFGVDVNLLLFAAYAGAREGVQLDAADIAAAATAVSTWHSEIVRALRGVRRHLKPVSLDDGNPLRAAAADLRVHVKAAELDAEKIEQAILWIWSRRQLAARSRGDASVALAANLRALLAYYRAPAECAAPAMLRTAALAFIGSKS
jgi:uncharacterized protein (TIGR02444 family)